MGGRGRRNAREVAQMLLRRRTTITRMIQKTDIIKGYEDGQLHEERGVTRAEALVMLKRAFGTLPKPVGHNARMALASGDFHDIPDWAKDELTGVFDAGIAAGTAPGTFSPDEPVTQEQMQLFIDRVFALYGTNEKDDFTPRSTKKPWKPWRFRHRGKRKALLRPCRAKPMPNCLVP